MGVNTTGLLNAQAEVYASYKNDAVNKNETSAKKDTTAKTEEKNESGVVYDKSDSSKDNKKATYSINKMSAEDRAALVQQMKADTQSRQQQLISIVQKMMTGHHFLHDADQLLLSGLCIRFHLLYECCTILSAHLINRIGCFLIVLAAV